MSIQTTVTVTLDIAGHSSTVEFGIERPDGKSIELEQRTPEELFLLSESIRTVFISESEMLHGLVKECARRAKE